MTEALSETLARIPIDYRESVAKEKVCKDISIIDRETDCLRKRLQDPTIDSRMVAKIIQNLSEKDINDFIDYVERKATEHKGKAFIGLCSKVMNERQLAA